MDLPETKGSSPSGKYEVMHGLFASDGNDAGACAKDCRSKVSRRRPNGAIANQLQFRISTVESDRDDQQAKELTRSLLLAQQKANDVLESYEEAAQNEAILYDMDLAENPVLTRP